MVKTISTKTGQRYQCQECGLQYAEQELAEKCEAWCRKHKSCNIEITEHAIAPEESAPGHPSKQKGDVA
ncbi:MAG: hypothetical protein WD850_03405 [Candidatus Spechtbacterales bacterium]